MLQAIRERAQGWIAWVIVILISIPFALWGIQEYLGVGGETLVAKVNGQEITERELNNRYQRFRSEMRERLGAAYRPELFDETRLRREVLEDMIRSSLITQTTAELGLNAGDGQVRAAILEVGAFQRDGRFDKAAYERALNFQGLAPQQFEQQVRASLMSAQLSQMVGTSELITDQELADAIRLKRQTRSFDYFVLPREEFESAEAVPEADIEAYYQGHQDAFRTPEQVRVEYLVLKQVAEGDGVEVDEQALQALYEASLDAYRTPEQRRARHILVTLSADASPEDEAAAKEKMARLQARLQAGEDFAVIAREASEDPGSAGQGGDLGFFERGIMDPQFEDTAFALEQGVVSEPVRSAFGYHLIEVMEIEAETVKPIEEVRDQLVKQHGADESERRYFELAEQLGNLSYESPDSLVPAAEVLEMQVQTSVWFDRDGTRGDGLFSNIKVVGAAFSDDVLKQGNNSELLEIEVKGQPQAVVLRVVEHQEASVKALDEVSEEISVIIKQNKAEEAALARAEELADKLRAGDDLARIAVDHQVVNKTDADRNSPAIPLEILDRAFTLSSSDGAPGVGVASLHDGSTAVVVLSEVKDGSLDELDDGQKRSERIALSRSLSRAYYDNLVDDIRTNASVEFLTTTSE